MSERVRSATSRATRLSSLTETSIKCPFTISRAIKSKINKSYIDSEGNKIMLRNNLNKSVKLPCSWEGAARNVRSVSNRTSSGNICRKDEIIMNKDETIDHTAGVNSGFIERFDLEKYNPKHVITPNKYESDSKRPYTTQKGLRAYRAQNDHNEISKRMEVWDELNPYWIDYVYPKDEKTGIGKNTQTVKEIKEQRTLEARVTADSNFS